MKTDVRCCGLTNSAMWNLTFRGPCSVIYSYNESQRDALFLTFTYLIKYSTCFGQVHCPSSEVSQHCIHDNSVDCLLADSQQNQHDKHLLVLGVYSVDMLLMMDSGPVRNMQSTLSNKFEKQCISLAFNTRIKHSVDECHIKTKCYFLNSWSIGLIPEGVGNSYLH